jgi:lipoic acid synthetase
MTPAPQTSAREAGAFTKPAWIRVRVSEGAEYLQTMSRLRKHRLHTVCEEALCPNRNHCWSHGRATILILGDRCTRRCRFCHVDKREVPPPDPDEPARVAAAVQASGLREVVLTSVTRDDLPDGGAALWAETIRRVHGSAPQAGAATRVANLLETRVLVEVLVPDFNGSEDALRQVCEARPEVFGHNLETVPRLYAEVRPEANYQRSLDVLRFADKAGLITKTSLMLGMGETRDEITATLRDARAAGVRILYCGQYLQPTRRHLAVARYLPPAEFEEIGVQARELGFDFVASAPLVRSSYHEEGQAEFVRKMGGSGRV